MRARLHAASLGATVSNVLKIQTLKFQKETDMPTARAAMAPAVPVFGTAGLSFAGWVLMLAGIGALQVRFECLARSVCHQSATCPPQCAWQS